MITSNAPAGESRHHGGVIADDHQILIEHQLIGRRLHMHLQRGTVAGKRRASGRVGLDGAPGFRRAPACLRARPQDHSLCPRFGLRPTDEHRNVRVAVCRRRRDDGVLGRGLRCRGGAELDLNRRWAWEISGRVAFLREVVGYVTISILALVASSAATGWTQKQVQSIPAHHGIRVALVTGSYVAVQAILFAVKFLIYEHWVFSGRSRVRAALRSRRQVWTAARANRTP